MSETTVTPPVSAAPVPTMPESLLARLKTDVENFAKQLGVDAEKLWTLVKEHM